MATDFPGLSPAISQLAGGAKVDVGRLRADLAGPFDLSSDRRRAAGVFEMQTTYSHFDSAGRKAGGESYVLHLRSLPADPARAAQPYDCAGLEVQVGDAELVSIPELTNWSYEFNPAQLSPLWGIPQERFSALSDGARPLPFAVRYAAYVNFIDFHSINDVFTRPMAGGSGSIQDLTAIGQSVQHPTAFMEAPITFGDEIKPGSTFRNGQVTLELKGLSVVDGSPCAILSFAAGDNTLKMITVDASGRESMTDGCSQYKGDIDVDLATLWVRRASLDEYQVAETRGQASGPASTEYTVRHIILRVTAVDITSPSRR